MLASCVLSRAGQIHAGHVSEIPELVPHNIINAGTIPTHNQAMKSSLLQDIRLM